MLRALCHSTCNVQTSACAANATLVRSFAVLHSCFYGVSYSPSCSTAASDLQQQQTCSYTTQTAKGGADTFRLTSFPTRSCSISDISNGSSFYAAQEQPVLHSKAASLPAASQQQQRPLSQHQHHQLPVLCLAASSNHSMKHWDQHQARLWSQRPWQQQQQQQWRGLSSSDGPEGNPDELPVPSGQRQQQQNGKGGRYRVMLSHFQQQGQEQSSSPSSAPSWQPVTLVMADRQHQQQTQNWQDPSQQQQQQQPLPVPQPQQQEQHEPETLIYPVHAVHLAGEIDFMGFANKYRDNFVHVIPAQRDHVLLQLESVSDNVDLLRYGTVRKSPEACISFVVIYRYGSVIFSNVRREARDEYLHLLRPFLKPPKGQPQMRPEDFAGLRSDETTIVVRSHLDHWSKLEPDKIVVQMLDAGNLRVISNVLSQSVALDYFNSRVDAAIQQFTPYLTAVAQTGQCDTVKEAGLLQLIADNSLLYTDVVTKIGLLDISQTAWKQDKHYDLWASLRADYEIEKRFDAINRKLGPMIENAKFLLDVRAEQKSSGAEWIIIGLIMLEVLMNGFGHLATFMWH